MAVKERAVDRTKRSNRKCEHCTHWQSQRGITVDNVGNRCAKCEKSGGLKKYYNCCKEFAWRGGENG